MKVLRKIVDLDYRNQTAKTVGLFSEPRWPSDDETVTSDIFRKDNRLNYGSTRRTVDNAISDIDPGPFSDRLTTIGRRER